ncbi:helix-turn-helix domain-containing protein [Brevibacterium metallidurans]|uniref:Helix-turn-helix domain-containing protein n=2 Tax=Brevibacterium metallidurans TaxID=1482676 RepID=A0ABN0SSH8_9MICO
MSADTDVGAPKAGDSPMLHEGTARDFDGWRSLVSDSFVPLATEPQRRGGFTGRISARDYDAVVMSHIAADPHAVLRTPELIGRGSDDYFKVSLQLSGHGLLIQDGREVALAPGTLAIYDTSRPYTLSFDAAFSSYVMMFPQSRVTLPADAVGQLTATAIGADHSLGEVVTGVIAQAGTMLPGLTRSVGVRLAGNVVDLLTTVMVDELSTTAEAVDERARLRAEVIAHIDAHLADPQLGPQTIAAAHFMSVRALHQLFEGHESVAGEIRRRRIERCRSDLADPLQAHVPVAAIGARWGFGDPAHFSRVFRRAVGQPPAVYRRTVLDEVRVR